jgi:hypothetical protein
VCINCSPGSTSTPGQRSNRVTPSNAGFFFYHFSISIGYQWMESDTMTDDWYQIDLKLNVENRPIHADLFPISNPKKETYRSCRCRSRFPSQSSRTTHQNARNTSIWREPHIHLISLYRCLQGIYDSHHDIYGMSPLGHIYGMSPINPLIEEFLTLTEKWSNIRYF